MGSACCILLVLLYALHKWSRDSSEQNQKPLRLSESGEGFYKSHINVYPVIKTGEWLKSVVLFV